MRAAAGRPPPKQKTHRGTCLGCLKQHLQHKFLPGCRRTHGSRLHLHHPAGLFTHPYPPPLLPKPGKDNIRLQKLLKRSAKKKAAAQASQSAAPFRSSLSPVNEASPDLEHSDHSSTPPKTPETPHSFYSHQPPRFLVKPVKPYQHVASPYPSVRRLDVEQGCPPNCGTTFIYTACSHFSFIPKHPTGYTARSATTSAQNNTPCFNRD
ncbi:hypothetical protein WMY93_012268 [Mugilogobius chulae]|uniref:Uncharacterized protein n=1 Tax=Mugilogobius chulae TaxID=88201 RepID=A0AAW0PDU4_9GOBI